MGKRAVIGVVFFPSDWMGGVYYVKNFLSAVYEIDFKVRPQIVLFYRKKEDLDLLDSCWISGETTLVRVPDEIHYSILERGINKVFNFFGRKIFEKRFTGNVDFLFPAVYDPFFDLIPHKVYWIPDLQDKYFPEFFPPEIVAARHNHYEKLANGNDTIVFSSSSSLNDFIKFYSPTNPHLFVLNFCSYSSHSKSLNEFIAEKYLLQPKFFFCPNQFWRHKDHITLIKASKILKTKGYYFSVAFSGKELDDRQPDFVDTLKSLVKELGLDEEVRFLGFIPKEDLFHLMKEAVSVVQPSLFEGWSTVIEDALSVGASIIASDLDVNLEQAKDVATFFRRSDPEDLAGKMELFLNGNKSKSIDYIERRKRYSTRIVELVEFVKKTQ